VLAPSCNFRMIRSARSPRTTRSATLSPITDLPAPVLERHPDGKPERMTDTGLPDPQAWPPLPAAL
jgi:hypothetical protein